MKIYVITSGCVYEGGSVNAVELDRDRAYGIFDMLLSKERESNAHMEEYAKTKRYYVPGEWTGEEFVRRPDGSISVTFHGMDFLDLKVYDRSAPFV
jgi:hypothetical protein